MSDVVTVRTRVRLPPPEAFRTFVADVDGWWRRGRRYRRWSDSRMRFAEHGLLEEHADAVRVVARVLQRVPPTVTHEGALHLEMDGDPVVIRFQNDDGGTRVVVEHRRRSNLTPFQSPVGLYWASLLAGLSRGT